METPIALPLVLLGATVPTPPSPLPDHMTVKSSISLTDAQFAYAKALVDAGRFPSVSAVLQQGVELLRRQSEAEEQERAALAALLRSRRTGPFLTGSRMDDRLARLIKRKRRAHAVPG